MRRAYLRPDLAAVAWMGTDRTRFYRENIELEEAITARDEVVEEAARDKTRYHNNLAVVAMRR
jgi:hypothetical protein